MTPAEITTFLGVFQTFVKLFDQVGVWGFLGTIIITPFLMICLVLWLNHSNNKRQEAALEAYRKEKEEYLELYRKQRDEFLEAYRKDKEQLLEAYRQDTAEILKHYGARHDDIIKRHELAMSQIKALEQDKATMHTLVVNNTQAMERLSFTIENVLKR